MSDTTTTPPAAAPRGWWTDEPIPVASVTLRHHRDGISDWVVVRCPYCGKRHTHGAGRRGVDDPRALLGSRVAHCLAGEKPSLLAEYLLVEADDEVGR